MPDVNAQVEGRLMVDEGRAQAGGRFMRGEQLMRGNSPRSLPAVQEWYFASA